MQHEILTEAIKLFNNLESVTHNNEIQLLYQKEGIAKFKQILTSLTDLINTCYINNFTKIEELFEA